ncbi:MAG: hypothetical protein ACYS22_14205 [Planctomycetota bacterium]
MLVSGWVNRHQQDVIEYVKAENRVLREQLRGRRVRLTNDQRRRLALKGKILGRKLLADVAGLLTPDTILRWYRVFSWKNTPRTGCFTTTVTNVQAGSLFWGSGTNQRDHCK